MPISSYGATKDINFDSKDNYRDVLKTHFILIKEMGFNTIRFSG